MFLRHFNLREQPFGVTPNPRFLYASATHREALAALVYGLESGLGFVALTANPGMGKTTLLFEMLRRLNETAKTVFLFQTIASPADLFRALLIDLGVENPKGTLVDHQTELNQYLVKHSASGRRLVIVIDEAQNLNDQVLEAVRMLSNFETGHRKLMHIVLSGQLQLAERLAGPDLLQLRQRISIFAHLRALTAIETAEYIQHRLKTAGWDGAEAMFTAAAMAMIAERSQGIPRNINNLCFNALSIACAMNKTAVDHEMVREVVADLDIAAVLAPSSVPMLLPAGEVLKEKQASRERQKKQDKPRKQSRPAKQSHADKAPPAHVVTIDSKAMPEPATPSAPVAAAERATEQLPLDLHAVPHQNVQYQHDHQQSAQGQTAQAQPAERLASIEPVAPPAAVVPIDAKTTTARKEQPQRQWPPRGLSHALAGTMADLSAEWDVGEAPEPAVIEPDVSDEFSFCRA